MSKSCPLIAVVDDEQSICMALRRLLRAVGLGVEVYSSGEEFLQAAKTIQFDCVLLDLHMPRVSGYEVLSRLAGLQTHIPVVAITGHDSPEARARALSAGAAAYLLKPVDDFMLLDTIATVTSDQLR